VIVNLTLDGVMQAPGRPDEDTRDGFPHGGWARPYAEDAMGRLLGRDGNASLLLERRTYEAMYEFWPKQPANPYTDALAKQQKYILLVHPLMLGTGRKLFADGDHATLRLVVSVATSTGVLIGTYEPEDQ
jgi:dihydrofolate reductase